MTGITVDKAEFIGLWLETLLYGIYVSLFIQTIRILVQRDDKLNWKLVSTCITIFVFATGHVVVFFQRSLEAFINHQNDKGGPIAYYANLRSATEVAQAGFFVAVTLMGDSMATYRVFVVYDRSYLAILLPLASLVATLVTSIGSVAVIAGASTRESAFYFPKLEIWMPAYFSLSFITSVVSTCLIVIRLWYLNTQLATYAEQRKSRRISVVQRILVESGALYSISMLLYLALYLAKSNYSIIFGDMVAPIIGIAFSLTTIRVNETFSTDPISAIAFSPRPDPRFSSAIHTYSGTTTGHSASPSSDIQLKSSTLAVEVVKTADTESYTDNHLSDHGKRLTDLTEP